MCCAPCQEPPKALETWLLELDKGHGNHATLDASVARLKVQLADMTDAEYRARHLVDQLALTMQASLLVQAGNNAVAGAFIASRLGTQSDRNYGTLPRGLDIDTIIARGNPTVS
jgi:putative acyl-CoA dehydrogenase